MNTFYLSDVDTSPESIKEVDDALATLERRFGGMPTLSAAEKLNTRTMGPKSEAFCRRAMTLLQLNPELLPPKVPLARAVTELQALDVLRPRLERLAKLNLRSVDTQFVAGRDIYGVAVEGYNQMRKHGTDEGLRLACQELGALFARASMKAKARRAALTAAEQGPPPDVRS
jgi:hypothetical protein